MVHLEGKKYNLALIGELDTRIAVGFETGERWERDLLFPRVL